MVWPTAFHNQNTHNDTIPNQSKTKMSYLKFDKNLLINLEQSLPKEMLRTNRMGAYHCTTLPGCNTRKQHGLLVIPIEGMGDKPHVLLSTSAFTATVAASTAPTGTSIYVSLTARAFPA